MPVSKATNAYELLGDIKRVILAEPKRYKQTAWLIRETKFTTKQYDFPACGTIGCVAGWALALTIPTKERIGLGGFSHDAQYLLGLTASQAEELFDGGAAVGYGQTRQHARSGARHIEAFRQSYKNQLVATPINPIGGAR